jgi:transcriptional regulator with XRE-family HTH domain
MTMRPGDNLRQMRLRLGISTREVEGRSKQIAEEFGNDDLLVSHSRIVQIENDESTPSIYKLCTLSAIYGIAVTTLVGLYLDMDKLGYMRMTMKADSTRPLESEPNVTRRVTAIHPEGNLRADQSQLICRLSSMWGELPPELVANLNLRRMKYGVIGLSDRTMHPLLRPGSFVQIDDRVRKITNATYATELDRPIYFLELRDRYVCSWCELRGNELYIIPHPLSSCQVEVVQYPADVDIIGRVTAVAARLVPEAGIESKRGSLVPPERLEPLRSSAQLVPQSVRMAATESAS